ncbi:hypothetical protein, partial [Streptomyces sp. SID3343]|uniref:hypothetical protein n=1 Tax=Streptomyces sp. SID3343 TaxID=2690260 RepID=UPI00136EB1D0
LGLAVSLVVNAEPAADALARLADTRRPDASGGLVFGCLLYLADHQDAARFWWQFAAGCGNRTAANCLSLHHRSHGQSRDADHWRAQSATLRKSAVAHPPCREDGRPLLADRIRYGLLAACNRGADPRLPAAVEAVLRRLAADADDEDFGGIPRPTADLPTELANVPVPAGVDDIDLHHTGTGQSLRATAP